MKELQSMGIAGVNPCYNYDNYSPYLAFEECVELFKNAKIDKRGSYPRKKRAKNGSEKEKNIKDKG